MFDKYKDWKVGQQIDGYVIVGFIKFIRPDFNNGTVKTGDVLPYTICDDKSDYRNKKVYAPTTMSWYSVGNQNYWRILTVTSYEEYVDKILKETEF